VGERRVGVSVAGSDISQYEILSQHTCAVSFGSQISNKRNKAHSAAPILCRWSAFFAEKVCTVIPGQSGRRSKSNSRKFVTKSRISGADMGFTA
jgi:hypothetical protein